MTSALLRERRVDIMLTLALGAAIAVVTLLPAHTLPEAPGSDKLHHFIAFMVFAIPVSLIRPRRAWVVFLIALALGASIEIIQPYVYRSRDIFDFRADAVGSAIGATIGLILAWASGLTANWPVRRS